MLIEEVNPLSEPGYQPIETGYFRLQKGHMPVRVLTRMPCCKGKMVDGWLADGLPRTEMTEDDKWTLM